MARIRSIKPDFWSSVQVMDCSPIARLLFIGIWNFADDKGRIPAAAKSLKAQIFPCDEIASETIQGMVAELAATGLVQPYAVDSKDYLLVTGWHHQKIDKPQPAKYPPPPRGNQPPFADPSLNSPGMVSTERIGEDRKGSESPSGPQAATDSTNATSASSETKTADADLFTRGREVLGKSCGGLISDLKKHFAGNVALARAAIEQASTKDQPREYVGAIIRGPKGQPDATQLAGGLWDRGM